MIRAVLGVALGLVVLGPGLGRGPLLNLDLLVTPEIPVPNGVFGLGPALTQRVPFFALLGLGSWLVGGPVAVKAAVVALIALGFVGAARLVDGALTEVSVARAGSDVARVPTDPLTVPAAALAPIAAGVLWAAGPFAITRLGAGHLNLIWVIGVLPWTLPHLWRPAADPRRTFLACLLVAVGGPAAGTLGLTALFVSLLASWPGIRPSVRTGVVAVVANLIWVGPTVVVMWAGAEVSSAGDFATSLSGPIDALVVAAGGGFWREDQQVGASGWVGVGVAAVIVGLAIVGRRALMARWGRASAWVAVVGLVLALVSAVPGLREPYRELSLLPGAAPLRESQRFLALWLAAAAPAAALGGAEVARRLASARSEVIGPHTDAARPTHRPSGVASALPVRYRAGLASVAVAMPLVAALVLSGPGWWGLDGRLKPVSFPTGWTEARDVIEADRGTVVALPWNEYPSISFAEGRTVFNPIPDFLGADVISSYDPQFDPTEPAQEQVDGRAAVVDGLVARLVAGVPVSADLADLGVRWVFLAKEDRWEELRPLVSDLGLRLAFDDGSVALYEVRGWLGAAVGSDGRTWDLERPFPPLLLTDAPAGTVLSVAGAPGWVRGWGHSVSVTDDGRLRLRSDEGPLWFWPAPLLLFVDLALLAAAVEAARRGRRT